MSNFSSDGFDLDAISTQDNSDVIYEVGGGATVIQNEEPAMKEVEPSFNTSEHDQCEEFKKQGNEQFKIGNYLEAFDLYTEAIEACPSKFTGEEILRLKDEFDEKQRSEALQRSRLSEERRRKKEDEKKNGVSSSQPPESSKPQPFKTFELSQEDKNDKLAVYYCNRAATLQHMEKYNDALKDCDVSALLNPKYTKAFVRRSAAHERLEDTEAALKDAKAALELDPRNATIRKTVARLEKIEAERLEKLKEETMGKLKDLGNSLLGNFGLSLDNFQAVQDPKTGSYNIAFNQNK
ncbi:unnamed protein product [Cylindrotheca closterium]|uniref:Tetratricopeptide repeat protein 1 n=1 Tax=Cylindrotheca closterium TaxID=2856 RepID=A0AAD2CD83_9STRA|nr:unnamed protein product [Cylindrotheca closterium]